MVYSRPYPFPTIVRVCIFLFMISTQIMRHGNGSISKRWILYFPYHICLIISIAIFITFMKCSGEIKLSIQSICNSLLWPEWDVLLFEFSWTGNTVQQSMVESIDYVLNTLPNTHKETIVCITSVQIFGSYMSSLFHSVILRPSHLLTTITSLFTSAVHVHLVLTWMCGHEYGKTTQYKHDVTSLEK